MDTTEEHDISVHTIAGGYKATCECGWQCEEQAHAAIRRDAMKHWQAVGGEVCCPRAAVGGGHETVCDNYDGPPDGEAWSGGFAENH